MIQPHGFKSDILAFPATGHDDEDRGWGAAEQLEGRRAHAKEVGNAKVSQISKTGTSASTRESQSILYIMLAQPFAIYMYTKAKCRIQRN